MPENNNVIFADGLRFDRPHENSPDFVKGRLSVNVSKFIDFLKEMRKLGYISEKGYLNFDLKKSKNETLYLQVNTFKPKTKVEESAEDLAKEIPF